MITCVLIVRNEAHRISATMNHVLSLPFNEVLVVDQDSDDGTADLLLGYEEFDLRVRLEHHPCYGTSEPSRPEAIRLAKGPWVFLLDADEEVTTYFSSRMNEFAASDEADMYLCPRIVFIDELRELDRSTRRFFHKDRVHVPEFPSPVQYLHSSVVARDMSRVTQLLYPCILSVKSMDEQILDNERYYSLGYPRPS